MFDEETEQLARRARAARSRSHRRALRHRLDSKIETTRLGNDAGVPSVPNTMGEGVDYGRLLTLADERGLGHDLVVQTPYGDSGQTTFFIASDGRLDRHEDEIVGQSSR